MSTPLIRLTPHHAQYRRHAVDKHEQFISSSPARGVFRDRDQVEAAMK